MRSSAEQDLIRRDASLPGLATLLDADAFGAALARALPGAAVRAAQLRYLRYKPGQNCLAAYRLHVQGAVVDCHAKAHRLGDPGKLAKAIQRRNHPGPFGTGRLLWPETGIEVCIFPNDNKLPALGWFAQADRRSDIVRRHLPRHPAGGATTLRPLAYKPERRWVAAIESAGAPCAVCKLYGGPAFETALLRARQFAPGEVLRVAPLLGRSRRHGALFLGWQPGRLLSEALLDPAQDASDCYRVGVALAELHRQSPARLEVRSPQREAEAVSRLGELLAFLLPAVADRFRRVAEHLAAARHATPVGSGTVHGDFYAKQVLVAADGVTVLDFDEAAQGDPLDDLGTFLAHLERERLQGRLGDAAYAARQAQFLDGYRAGGGTWDPVRLPGCTALHLFGRLPHFFRNHDALWPERTSDALAQVERLLTPSARTGAPPSGVDANLPALGPALQPSGMERRLRALGSVGDSGWADATLRRITLLRHKPGRRALIEYVLDQPGAAGPRSMTVLGKLRRRGVDEANVVLWRALCTGAFRDAAEDGIAVPTLRGVLPELGMTLQERVPAATLASQLIGPAGARAARRAAEAVCKLHRSELSPGRAHTLSDELALLEARLREVAAARPEWHARLRALMEGCRRRAADLPPVAPRPIHRDFYPDQLLLAGDRVWLLDLDLLCAGDPALDAGNFAGHLIERGIRAPSERNALDQATAAFLGRFDELSGPAHRVAVTLYTTLTLARHLHISGQFPDRAPFAEEILRHCEARCGLASTDPHRPRAIHAIL